MFYRLYRILQSELRYMKNLFHEPQDLYKRFSNFIYQNNRDIIDLEKKLKNNIDFLKKYQYRDELKPEKDGITKAPKYFSKRSKTPSYSSLEDIKAFASAVSSSDVKSKQ